MPESTAPPKTRLVIARRKHQVQYFTEQLDDRTALDMMQIPAGQFMMGQTKAERDEIIRLRGEKTYQESYADELPRHQVTVSSFFLGKYPITQAQWRAVANNYPAVEQELKSDPSDFKGENRPVEDVSWDDATEFCRRLSQATGRDYHLPSEAQWEYACRAGTTTPFHFGETIDAELANYAAQDEQIGETLYKGTYGRGILGEYRRETTEVGQFPANAFGLYDMHGNVWEWCEDDWHENYQAAPDDDRAWVERDRESTYRLLRGGSWNSDPVNCRSAVRDFNSRAYRTGVIGIRVSCASPRT